MADNVTFFVIPEGRGILKIMMASLPSIALDKRQEARPNVEGIPAKIDLLPFFYLSDA
jgi:hypothetical protein